MPRDKTVTYKVYKFSELSEKAKEHAKQNHCAAFGYYMTKEALESLKKLAEHFGGKLVDWDIDWFRSSHSSVKFDMPNDMTRAEIRKRLVKLGTWNKKTLMGHGSCKLTGICTDEDCIDGFRRAFLQNGVGGDLNDLIEEAFKTWLKAQQKNAVEEYTDETFGEMCEINEYEFLESGEMD